MSGSLEVDGCERGCRKWNPCPLSERPALLTIASSPEAFLGLFQKGTNLIFQSSTLVTKSQRPPSQTVTSGARVSTHEV